MGRKEAEGAAQRGQWGEGCKVEEEDLTDAPRPEGGGQGTHVDTWTSCAPGRVSCTCKGPGVRLAWGVGGKMGQREGLVGREPGGPSGQRSGLPCRGHHVGRSLQDGKSGMEETSEGATAGLQVRDDGSVDLGPLRRGGCEKWLDQGHRGWGRDEKTTKV